MVTEFISKINAGGGGDFSALSTLSTTVACDLTSPAGTKVFSHGGIVGALAPADVVTGQTSGSTGIIAGITTTQVLLKNIVGTFTVEQMAKTVGVDFINSSDSGDTPVVVAEGEGTTADTTAIIFNSTGWVTSATNNIIIRCVGVNRHVGIYNTGLYRIESSLNVDMVTISSINHVKFRNVQLKGMRGGTHRGFIISNGATFNEISGSLVFSNGVGSTSRGIRVITSGVSGDIYNNLFYNWGGSSLGDEAQGMHTQFYQNTISSCINGITQSNTNGRTLVSNCVFENNTTDANVTVHPASGFNCTDNASLSYTGATGGSDKLLQNYATPGTFINSAGQDFRLATTDLVAKDGGRDHSTDPGAINPLIVTDDVIGTVRPQGVVYDMGFFELIQAGVPALTPILRRRLQGY